MRGGIGRGGIERCGIGRVVLGGAVLGGVELRGAVLGGAVLGGRYWEGRYWKRAVLEEGGIGRDVPILAPTMCVRDVPILAPTMTACASLRGLGLRASSGRTRCSATRRWGSTTGDVSTCLVS